MKFKYTILYVKNVEQSLTFFSKAFGLKRKMLHESGDYGELDTGNTILSFSAIELMRSLGKSPANAIADEHTFEIAFETDNVAEALATAITAGAKLVQDAEEMPWGQTTAYVSEENGFLIEICTPVGG